MRACLCVYIQYRALSQCHAEILPLLFQNNNEGLSPMTMFQYAISSLSFSDGRTVSLSSDDIVLIVGSNNAGKSRALKEIVKHLDHKEVSGDPSCVVLKRLVARISEDKDAITSFLNGLDKVPAGEPQV